MKNLICSLAVTLLLIPALNAQKNIIDEIFQKYAKLDGVEIIDMSGMLLNLMCKNDKDLNQIKLDGLRVLSIENTEANKGINFYKEIVPELKLDNYKELMRVTEKDEQVIMLVKENKGKFEEFLIVVGGSENTLVSITGEIDLAHLDDLGDMVEIDIDVDIDND